MKEDSLDRAVDETCSIDRFRATLKECFGPEIEERGKRVEFATLLFAVERAYRSQGVPKDEADEVVSEVCERLKEVKFGEMKIDNLPGFLFVVTLRTVRRYLGKLRKLRLRAGVAIHLAGDGDSALQASDRGRSDAVEVREILPKLLALLPDRERRLISCVFFQGMSPRETMAFLRLRRSNFYLLRARALKFLRRELTSLGITSESLG